MKKLSILFLSAIALFTVSSCSSDDNEGTLEGKWALTHSGAIVSGKEYLEPVEIEGGCDTDTYEFVNNGTFTDTFSDFDGEKCTSNTENGTWSKDGKKLSLKYTGNTDTDVFEITELSGSTLKLVQTYSEMGISVSFVSVYKKK